VEVENEYSSEGKTYCTSLSYILDVVFRTSFSWQYPRLLGHVKISPLYVRLNFRLVALLLAFALLNIMKFTMAK